MRGNGPAGERSSSPLLGAGSVLRLIRDGEAVTRAGLTQRTGLSRSTVAQRVDALLAHELVYEAGDSASTGGRPPTVLAFNREAGVVLAADLGATHSRLAVTDLGAQPLDETPLEIDIGEGPEAVLERVHAQFMEMLERAGRTPGDVRGIGVGVPGPVKAAAGAPVNPPIMPGWDGFPIPEWFAKRYEAPVLVDNDVNIMALGEHWSHWRDTEHLLFVKIGTGIGCGIVAGGAIHRGAQGAAGDIGHISVQGHDDVVCSCGNVGCLEAVASGPAISKALKEIDIVAESNADIVDLVRGGNIPAALAVRQAGRTIGEVLATCVSLLNPSVIVIGGSLVQAGESLIAGVREVVYGRSLPLATGVLQIVPATTGVQAGVIGAATMVIQHALTADRVDLAIAQSAS
jgi:predicted NBD/HSP70 family sugar kinase